MNPQWWGMVISGIGAIGTVVGILLARMGKKGDQELQSVGDQFTRLMTENTYLTSQAKEAREEVREVRTEWEQRWDRQMARCRQITDLASASISRLMGAHTPADETNAEQTMRDIDRHNHTDHT